MGVMGCHRMNCENIMCSMYSSKYGYLCYDCFNELVQKGITTNVKAFMESSKDDADQEVDESIVRAHFSKIFPDKDEP